MRVRVIVSPPARREIREAYLWYRRADPRAAERFQQAVDDALAGLAEAPGRWAEVAPGVRRLVLPRHRYTLIYRIEGTHVDVLAVVHQSRHPDAWRREHL